MNSRSRNSQQRARDTRSPWTFILLIFNEHGGIFIEANIELLRAPHPTDSPYDDCLSDIALLDRPAWRHLFDRHDNHITYISCSIIGNPSARVCTRRHAHLNCPLHSDEF